jgi:SAM-dependent methyltransferase
MSNRFEERYRSTTTPPWEIGRPQATVLELLDEGAIRGRVLDLGCGTGHNTMAIAARGLDVIGVDYAPTAIDRARARAAAGNVAVRFEVGDALALGDLGLGQFDTVLDTGVLHAFSDDERPRYLASLAAAVRPGGHYLALVFSDRQPGDQGPRRMREDEIRGLFASGWRVESIAASRYENQSSESGAAQAWLATISRQA